jgi:hypothetical protein
VGVRRTEAWAKPRWALWGALLVACGSRSELLDGTQNPQGTAGNAGTATQLPMGGTPSGFGGNITSPFGGFSGSLPTFGGFGGAQMMPPGGMPFGGIAGLAGSPAAGQPAEAGAPPTEGGAGAVEPGDVLWGKRFGDESSQAATGIAVEDSGITTLTGYLEGTADFGRGSRVGGGGSTDVFVAQFNGDGSPRWANAWGGAGLQQSYGVALSSEGHISVVGGYSGKLNFGFETIESVGAFSAFLLNLDHEGGYRHAASFSGESQLGTGVAVAADGLQVWSGHFRGQIGLGNHSANSKGAADAIMAGIAQDKSYKWDLEAGDSSDQHANAVAHVESDDTFVVAGDMLGSLKLGACSTLTSAGNSDAWVGWLDGGGNCWDALSFGDGSAQIAHAVATGKSPLSHLVAVVGDFSGDITLADGITAIDQDAFVLLLAADPNRLALVPQWIRRIGGSGAQNAYGVAFDTQDNLIVVGRYTGDVNDPPLKPLGDTPANAYAVKYDVSGNVQWAKSFGDSDAQAARAVGTDADGNVYVAGEFWGNLPLTNGTLKSSGGADIFLLKLAP